MSLKLVFMGTPDFSVPVLARLVADGHDIAMVYSQPPRKAGRGMAQRLSPVHSWAVEHGLQVRHPVNFKAAEDRGDFAALKADAAIVVAYGLILPSDILASPHYGCFNLHASNLPRWRGAAPIQRAIMAGDHETAVCVMRMEAGLDTGPVCLSQLVPIGPQTTAGELHDELARTGAQAMSKALERLQDGKLCAAPQADEGITYARKITKFEAHIDFSNPVKQVLHHIHGLSPFPGAWCFMPGDKKSLRVKILRAESVAGNIASHPPGAVLDERFTIACGDGAIRPILLQREGKAAMDLATFLRGITLKPTTQLD